MDGNFCSCGHFTVAFDDFRYKLVSGVPRCICPGCHSSHWLADHCADVSQPDFLSGYGITREISSFHLYESIDLHHRADAQCGYVG